MLNNMTRRGFVLLMQVEAVKLFSVKAVNLGVILYQLYSIQEAASAASDSMSGGVYENVASLTSCDSTKGDSSCGKGFTCCDDECTIIQETESLKVL